MISDFFLNHLWQSTLFAAAAALLTLLFRKNHARVRYALWLAASIKFLIPFSLFIAIGISIDFDRQRAASIAQPAVAIVEGFSRPFGSANISPAFPFAEKTDRSSLIWMVVSAMWFGGCLAVLAFYLAKSRRMRAEVRKAELIKQGRAFEALQKLEQIHGRRFLIKVKSSNSLMEPGVFGIFRPALLIPLGMPERLNDSELEAVIAHELSHVRCHDNLVAAIHMFIEALFWFHPMIWWLGSKLVQERERACDEEVLRLGKDPQMYAEGILKICEFYLESPLACVAGITGSDMKKRIHAIMTQHIGGNLSLAKKLALAGTAIVAISIPLAIGFLNAPSIKAQEKPKVEGLVYDVVSIKQPRLDYRLGVVVERGRLYGSRVTVRDLMVDAYGVYERQISGGPAWVKTQRFYIEAKMDEATAAKLEKMSNRQRQAERQHMLQTVLAERFKLKVHREMKEAPVYALVIAKSGFKLKEADPKASVFSKIYYMKNYPLKWNDFAVGSGNPGLHLSSHGIPVSRLVGELNWELDRVVLDKTGLTGNYDIDLKWIRPLRQGAPTEEAGISLVSADPGPTIFSALEEQLGLKLDAIKAPMEAIVIDHVEKPAEN